MRTEIVSTGGALSRGVTSDERLIQLRVARKSPHTAEAYQRDIEQFRRFCNKKPLREVTYNDLQGWWDSLERLQLSSRVRKLAAVKSVLSLGHRIGYLVVDVGRPFELPAPAQQLHKKLLSEEQVVRLITAEEHPMKSLFLRLLYVTGCRVSELVQLRWEDVIPRESGGQITVVGKGSRTRAILLSRENFDRLTALGPGDEKKFVFSTRSGRSWSRHRAFRIVQQAALKAKIRKRVGPHMLRHAHASHAISRGCKLPVVRDTLGHADLKTTSRYVHAKPEESSSTFLPI